MTLYSFIYKTENSCAQNSIFSYPSYFCSDVYLKCLLWNNAYCLFSSTLVFSIYVCCRCRPDLCSITFGSELHQSLSGDPLQRSHRELGYLQIQTAILAQTCSSSFRFHMPYLLCIHHHFALFILQNCPYANRII